MPIAVRDDAVFIILNKIDQAERGEGPEPVNFSRTDFAGMRMTPADLLGHLDYLNQEQYIQAEFTGNAYATQEDVPDVVDADSVDLRIANTLGAPDGPLPHLITFDRAELTDKGRKILANMRENPPEDLRQGPHTPLPDKHMPFLEKVMVKGNLSDPYDARDITEIVFRVMRDVMSTEEADRVKSELHGDSLQTDDKALQNEIAELWQDTNPIVGLLSRVRPPLKGDGWMGIDSTDFLTRIDREGGVPAATNAETVTAAVFSATKEELSPERVKEVADWLPDGKVKQLWQAA